MSATASGPLYLTGLDRSGKTPLRRALVESTDVWLSRHTSLWSRHWQRYGDLRDPVALRRCLGALMRNEGLRDVLDHSQWLPDVMRDGLPTYGRLFELVLSSDAARHGRSRWGEQDADIEACAFRPLDDSPNAQVIHLLRDPRARYLDIVRAEGRKPGRVGLLTAAWLRSVARAESNRAAHPDRYHVLRFEDVLEQASPAAGTLRALCGRDVPIGAGRVGTDDPLWSRLSADLMFIEERAGVVMGRYGYERRVRRSRGAVLRYHAEVRPLAAVRAAAHGIAAVARNRGL
jgi:hypothetical protein